MLTVNEIFFSLQGESSYVGFPCIFIRLSGCNLKCIWCDTRYALTDGRSMTIEEILTRIKQYPCELVELTGGEPLCHPESIQLMEQLLQHEYQVLLETNGSMDCGLVPPEVTKIVDVKLPGSGCWGSFNLDNLEHLELRDEIKFVITDREDFDTAISFIDEHDLEYYEPLFSPVTDRLDPALLADWILKSGRRIRLQLQLHKLLDIK